jgi:hypothetical protein
MKWIFATLLAIVSLGAVFVSTAVTGAAFAISIGVAIAAGLGFGATIAIGGLGERDDGHDDDPDDDQDDGNDPNGRGGTPLIF